MRKSQRNSLRKGIAWFLAAAMLAGGEGTGTLAAVPSGSSAAEAKAQISTANVENADLPYEVSFGDGTEAGEASTEEPAAEAPEVEEVPAESGAEEIADVPEENTGEAPEEGENPQAVTEIPEETIEDELSAHAEADSGEEIFIDSQEETVSTDLLAAAAEAQEGTIQYLINQAQASGTGAATVVVGEEFAASVIAENLVIPQGMEIALDLGGHTLTVNESGRSGENDLNNITVFGSLTLKNGVLSGAAAAGTDNGTDTAAAGADNGTGAAAAGTDSGADTAAPARGIAVMWGGALTLEADARVTGYAAKGSGGGIYVNQGGALTLNGGTVEGNTSAKNGGGIYIYNGGKLAVNSAVIKGNYAAGNGGGIAIYTPDGKEQVLGANVALTENSAGNYGGGLYTGAKSILTLDGCEITKNSTKTWGGALLAAQGSTVTMKSGSIKENSAEQYGGGIFLLSDTNNRSTFTMSGGCIGSNAADGEDVSLGCSGGGIYAQGYSTLTLTGNAQITENKTRGAGGGICTGNNAALQIEENAAIERNTARGNGGGIYISSGSRLLINNGSISENEVSQGTAALACGGGCYAYNSSIIMTAGSVNGNTASGSAEGGGFYLYGTGLDMSGGEICGNTASGSGGGVRNGTVTMSGDARIAENKSGSNGGGANSTVTLTENAVIEGNTAYNGGGVCGTVNLQGGAIRGNKGNNGGGIYGSLTMTEGEVCGNTAGSSGGGVHITASSSLSGGSIHDNQATGGWGGGGIRVDNGNAVLHITGTATIENNRAESASGGGVELWNAAACTVDGGIIRNNYTATNGGGLVADRYAKELTISGNAKIYDNTAKNKNGAMDVWVSGTWKGGTAQEPIYYTPKVHMAQAATLSTAEGTSGIAWYEEQTETKATEAIELSGDDRADALRYTFLYKEEEVTEQVVSMDGEIYPSVQAAVDKLREAGDATEHRLTMLADSREAVRLPANVNICLDLQGKALKGMGAPVIETEEGSALTIEDTSEDQTGKITGGTGKPSEWYNQGTYGGGLYSKGTVVLKSGSIENNKNGGVYLYGNGSFTMEGGAVKDNGGDGIILHGWPQGKAMKVVIHGGEISGNNGAGVSLSGTGSLTMTDGLVEKNHTTGSGGGISAGNGTLKILGGTIRENQANGHGGGIYSNVPAEISGCVVEGNKAGNQGGGIWINGNNRMITDVEVKNNTSGAVGGGICVNSGIVTITRVLAEGNTATNGGGICHNAGTLTMDKSTVTGNQSLQAGCYGGGIYGSAGTLTVTDSSIYGNRDSLGKNDLHGLPGYGFALPAAGDMGLTEYNGWHDSTTGGFYSGKVEAAPAERVYRLYAARQEENSEEKAAVIGETSDTEVFYPTLQAAVEAAKPGERIYLLKDLCEQVSVAPEKNVLIDLNRYTLTSPEINVFEVWGSLELTDTGTNAHANPDSEEGGKLTATDGEVLSRGVYIGNGGSFTLSGGTITGFRGMSAGGGIYGAAGAKVSIKGGVICHNQAESGGGIAMASVGTAAPIGFDISGGNIYGNEAENGGGIYLTTEKNEQPMTFTLSGGSIHDNTAGKSGGGFYLWGGSRKTSKTECLFTGGTVYKNTAAVNGGGFFAEEIGRLVIGAEVTASYNESKGNGGGIRGLSREILMEGGTFHHNRAKAGGGACLYGTTLTVKDCDSHHNAATDIGGGLSLAADNEGLMEAGSVWANSSRNGGGIRLYVGTAGTFAVEEGVHGYENHATSGGGLYAEVNKTLTFKGTLENNTATSYGGGGYLLRGETILSGARLLNNSAANWGGGCHVTSGKLKVQEQTLVEGNTATWSGGGIGMNEGCPSLEMTGGIIRNNKSTSEHGGGICTRALISEISGGIIEGNTAAQSGGGICFIGQTYWSRRKNVISGDVRIRGNKAKNGGGVFSPVNAELTMTGGVITRNWADYGGGVCLTTTDGAFTLPAGAETGKIYGNAARYGKDVRAGFDAKVKGSVLLLTAASGMFGETENKKGICWYDEDKSRSITDPIAYSPVLRAINLTLQYDSLVPVAKIANPGAEGGYDSYTSVQAAMDAVKNGVYETISPDAVPEIVMVEDSSESVKVSGDTDAVLNLNGHRLLGTDTAITCYGKLLIKDEKQEELHPGEETGTISGGTKNLGGGIHVLSGGYVRMESGQIANSIAGDDSNSGNYGGGGAAVEGGTFVLAGTASIHHCSASVGGAVYVGRGNSVFEMEGGRIEENTGTYGSVWINGGIFRMGDGVITQNRSGNAGTIRLYSGKAYLTGGEITDNKAADGGALYIGRSAFAQLSDIKITGNQATNRGGAIFSEGSLNIFDGTLLENNTAANYGGAIYQLVGNIKMIGGAMVHNEASKGGGLAQNPNVGGAGSFSLSGGMLCDNTSTLDGTGNDIYSLYEGTGNYDNIATGSKPSVTLIRAVDMRNPEGNPTPYNVWKNDAYTGSSLEGSSIMKGHYITGGVAVSNNLKFTASVYGEQDTEEEETTIAVKTFGIINTKGEDGMTDGTAVFDTETECREKEKTALAFLEDTENTGAYEAEEVTEGETPEEMAERHHYLYNGEILRKICYNDVWYEREQMVEWSPGDDSNSKNSLVRSFDTISYNFQMTLEDTKKTEGETGEEGTAPPEEEKKENLHLWIEAELPLGSEYAAFNPNGLSYYYTFEKQKEDGSFVQCLRGYWERPNEAGTAYYTLSAQVRGMDNGELLKPTFSVWVGGNKENEAAPLICESRVLTVSAAPRYNAVLQRNSALGYTSYFNLLTGEESSEKEVEELKNAGADMSHIVHGTMLGYGVTLQTCNDKTGKGMRGIQIPKDKIEFDVSLGGSLYLDGSPLGANAAPYPWAYKENRKGAQGNNFDNTSYTYNMDWNDEDDITRNTAYAWDGAPFYEGGTASACYSGGFWQGQVKDSAADGDRRLTLHFAVDGYALSSSASPTQTSDGKGNSLISAGNSFSAGYLQVIYPVDEELVKDKSGYLEINMEAMVSDLDIRCATGLQPETTDEGLDVMEEFFGEAYKEHAVNEMRYSDNYLKHSTGLYIYNGSGNADSLGKNNYFNKSDRYNLVKDSGTGSTPIGTQVYIAANVSFGSQVYNTTEEGNVHYIPPEEFNSQVDNRIEYNYMTAMNLLQKFDADAYTPVCTEEIVDRPVRTAADTVLLGARPGTNTKDAFAISTTESATTWSQSGNLKTRSYDLTVLYGAKPDGTNWDKTGTGRIGGEADMDAHKEKDLIYFTSLSALKDYFATQGNPDGKCVALLYEFRNCCIRTGRSFTVTSRMQVTDDFYKTGATYCTTNDVTSWSTYRPIYKKYYSTDTLSEILYKVSWRDKVYGEAGGATAYGNGDIVSGNPYPEGYEGSAGVTDEIQQFTKQKSVLYFDGYRKTEYEKGSKVDGTHAPGWFSGNSLLLYTLTSSIGISNTDLEEQSNRVKTYYNVSEGERTANFVVRPGLFISSSVKDHELVANGSQATDVEITLTLPKHLNYNKGSLVFDYTSPGAANCKYQEGDLAWDVQVDKNENGTTTITLRTTVNDISKGLPYVRYDCTIGTKGAPEELDVQNGQSLTTRAKINTTYQETGRITCHAQNAENTIIARRTRNDVIYKEAGERLVELGDDLVYYLNYGNITDVNQEIELCDILPANNDGRGTAFGGGYRVKELHLDFTSQEDRDTFLGEQGGALKYRAGLKADLTDEEKKAVFEEASGDSGTLWKGLGQEGFSSEIAEDGKTLYRISYALGEAGLIQNDRGNGTASALYGYVPAVGTKERLRLTLVLSPRQSDNGDLLKGNGIQEGGDCYGNDFFYRNGVGEAAAPPVTSAQVTIKTAERSIGGIAWMDMDQDGFYRPTVGGYASTDRVLSGVDVRLYQAEAPISPLLTANEDGTWSQTVGKETVTFSGTEINGQMLYPAVDIIGNLVKKAVTGTNGAYRFSRLAQGTYYVVFEDEEGNYMVAATQKQPLPFEKLSITPGREDTEKVFTQPGTATDKALPEYESTAAGENGPEALARAVITNNGKGIVLPALESIYGEKYLTNHWDCGLYYVERTMVKKWLKTTKVPKGSAVEFKVSGQLPGKDTWEAGVLTAEQTGEKTAEVTGSAAGTGITVTAPAVKAALDAKEKTITWTIEKQPFQAEGASGVIAYTISETARDAERNSLPGFLQTETQTEDNGNGVETFTAWNTQVIYGLSIKKTDRKAPEHGLSDAVFTVFKDKECKIPAGVRGTTAEGGIALAEGLEAGTGGVWYVRETKAPAGYSLNEGILELTISYPDKEKPCEPQVTMKRITDEKTGRPLEKAETVSITVTPVPGDGEVPLSYTIAFAVADDVLFTLPLTGENGRWWYVRLGVVLLLAGIYYLLSEEKKKQQIK